MKGNEIKEFRNIQEYVHRYYGSDTKANQDFYILRYDEIKELSGVYVNSFRNSFFEVSLDLSVGCLYKVDNYNCVPEKNRISIVSPFRLQSIQSSGTQNSEQIKGYSLFFTAEFLDFNVANRNLINRLPFISHAISPIVNLNDDSVPEFINLFERIAFHQNHRTMESESIVKHYINILLLSLKNYHNSPEPIHSINRGNQIFAEFSHLLETKFLEFASVKQFADKLNLSSKHFSETVKLISGKTPIQYINERKIDYAKSLLTHTDMSIKNIALELQFQDETYFYTFFKRVNGVTPTQYRAK